MNTFSRTTLAAALAVAICVATSAALAVEPQAANVPSHASARHRAATTRKYTTAWPELSALSATRDMLELEKQNAQLRQDIHKIHTGKGASNTSPSAGASANGKSASTSQVVSTVALPLHSAHAAPPPPPTRLLGTLLIGHHRQATVYDRGVRVRVQPGSKLPSGWTVAAIDTGSVLLHRGRATKHLFLGD